MSQDRLRDAQLLFEMINVLNSGGSWGEMPILTIRKPIGCGQVWSVFDMVSLKEDTYDQRYGDAYPSLREEIRMISGCR
jgi:hypothetical protein